MSFEVSIARSEKGHIVGVGERRGREFGHVEQVGEIPGPARGCGNPRAPHDRCVFLGEPGTFLGEGIHVTAQPWIEPNLFVADIGRMRR